MSDSLHPTKNSENQGHITLLLVRSVGLSVSCLAICVTVVRLWDRKRHGRLWWDDFWAFFGMVILFAYAPVMWVFLGGIPPQGSAKGVTIFYWAGSLFLSVVWASRISIVFTIIRIQYGSGRLLFAIVAMLFGAIWATLVGQMFWVCEGDTEWKQQPQPQCFLGLEVAITHIVVNVVTDSILVGTPLWMVYRSPVLKRHQKWQLFALFSTTVIMTSVSVAHSYFMFKTGGIRQSMTSVLECPISLLVANLSVVSSAIFRYSARARARRRLRRRLETQRRLSEMRRQPPPPEKVFGNRNAYPTSPFTMTEETIDVQLRDIDSNLPYTDPRDRSTEEDPDDEDERATRPIFSRAKFGYRSGRNGRQMGRESGVGGYDNGVSSTFLTSDGKVRTIGDYVRKGRSIPSQWKSLISKRERVDNEANLEAGGRRERPETVVQLQGGDGLRESIELKELNIEGRREVEVTSTSSAGEQPMGAKEKGKGVGDDVHGSLTDP